MFFNSNSKEPIFSSSKTGIYYDNSENNYSVLRKIFHAATEPFIESFSSNFGILSSMNSTFISSNFFSEFRFCDENQNILRLNETDSRVFLETSHNIRHLQYQRDYLKKSNLNKNIKEHLKRLDYQISQLILFLKTFDEKLHNFDNDEKEIFSNLNEIQNKTSLHLDIFDVDLDKKSSIFD
jgi:hypothetical protein